MDCINLGPGNLYFEFAQTSGFRKRGLANGVSPFFSENETEKNGRKRKKTEKNGKKRKETEKNGRKRKKTEKNGKNRNPKKQQKRKETERNGKKRKETEKNGKKRKETEQTEENGKKRKKTERKQGKKTGKKRKKTEENGRKRKKTEKIGSDTVPATPFAKPRRQSKTSLIPAAWMCVMPSRTVTTPKLQHQRMLHQMNSWQFVWCNVLHRVTTNKFPPIFWCM